MAPPTLPFGKVTLTYPLYACDFDPQDATRLVVGGGGGAGRSGVGNKITVLTTGSPFQLDETAEIDLSKDEDNITSLAVGQKKGSSTPIYAGINSSPDDVAKGENKHFRVFHVDSQKKGAKTAKTTISEKSRSTLFALKDKDAYQRVTRISKPFGGPQLGVVATGLAKKSEVVLFDTSASVPKIRGKVELTDTLEAEDADVIQSGKDEFMFVYCTKKSVFFKKISASTEADPVENIYTIPGPDDPPTYPPIMSFRSIRFLTPEFVLCLLNIADRGGVVLQVLRLPTTARPDVRTACQARLAKNVLQATGLAVTFLSAPETPEAKAECGQFAIAVAGHDTSITLLSLEYQSDRGLSIVANFKTLKTLKNVHPLQMTGIALSNFIKPANGEQPILKLASVSMANTVVTHTLPVTTTTFGSKSGTPHHVLDITPPGRPLSFWIISSIMILLVSLATQAVLEVRDTSPSIIGAKGWMTPFQQSLFKPVPGERGILDDFRDYLSPPSKTPSLEEYTTICEASNPTPDTDATQKAPLNELLSSLVATQNHESGAHSDHVIFLREEEVVAAEGTDVTEPASIKADLHHEDTHGPHGGKTWQELSDYERRRWVKKLKQLGHSAEDLGITVMKGVVFGTIGGAIGAAVG